MKILITIVLGIFLLVIAFKIDEYLIKKERIKAKSYE